MKKLTYLVSALAAVFGYSAAQAEVSVSGSATLAYQSAGSDTNLHNGGAVSFGLSTTTASGMTVSSSAGITLSATATGDGSDDLTSSSSDIAEGIEGEVTGFENITFATSGVTLTVGRDIALPDGKGEVGGLVSDITALNSKAITNTTGLADDEGAGISFGTSMGDMALTFYYIADNSPNPTKADIDGASGTQAAILVSTDVGNVGITGAYVSNNDTQEQTETAIAASYAMGAGTLKVGYTASTGGTASDSDKYEGNSVGVAYSLNLDADTTLALGYQTHDVNSTTGRATDITISRSLGGGASVFAEMRSTSGTTTSASGQESSVMSIGTSVSF